VALFKYRHPLIVSGSTGFDVDGGDNIDGLSRDELTFTIGQDVATTSDVVFNQVTPNSIIIGSIDSTHIVLADKSVSASNGALTQTAGEYLNISGDLTVPNVTLTGNLVVDKIEVSLTGSNTLYESGSTEFGDDSNDVHYITGSMLMSGSYALNNSTAMVEISNDTTEDGGSQTALATENVAYNAFGNQTPGFLYSRKKYAHKGSFVSSTTSSFTAVTASAPSDFVDTSKHDFMFFNQGMLMEHDAIDIEQSSSKFLMKINASSLGYGLDSTDEVVVWGKFNSPGYLDFDGLTNEVTTDFSGSSATPLNKTYSWWMKSTQTNKNYSVFGHGSNKRGTFTPNFSSGRALMWNGNNWYTYWQDTSAQDDGEWHHWMVYNDVETIVDSKLYVDGIKIGVSSFTTSGTVSNLNTYLQPLTIGAYKNNSTNTSHHFEGSIREFAVFSGDKTSNAAKYYNKGAPYNVTNESDLQGYWKMYEGSGTTVEDLSGEGNHGTIDGASWYNM